MRDRLESLIKQAKFEEAAKIASEYSPEDLGSILLGIVSDESNITIYSFICYVLMRDESIAMHGMVSTLAAWGFSFLYGGEETALYHMRKKVELSDKSPIQKKGLLLFYNNPYNVFSAQEAKEIAQEILSQDSGNEEAQKVLSTEVTSDIREEYIVHESDSVRIKAKKRILSGEFLKAKKLLNEISKDVLYTLLLEIAHDEKSICAYSFVCFLMIDEETAELHSLASDIIGHQSDYLMRESFVKGVFETSFFHAKQAVMLSPEEAEYKKKLLFFSMLPGVKLLDDSESEGVNKELNLDIEVDGDIAFNKKGIL